MTPESTPAPATMVLPRGGMKAERPAPSRGASEAHRSPWGGVEMTMTPVLFSSPASPPCHSSLGTAQAWLPMQETDAFIGARNRNAEGIPHVPDAESQLGIDRVGSFHGLDKVEAGHVAVLE